MRADDADYLTLIEDAIDYAGGEVDQYCQGKYLQSDLSNSQYVNNVATSFALEWFSLRRFNTVSESLSEMCDRYRDMLEKVLEGRAVLANVPRSRRPVTVTTRVVDLRRFNNQVRTDRTKSTGVAKGYIEPIDPTAPDNR